MDNKHHDDLEKILYRLKNDISRRINTICGGSHA